MPREPISYSFVLEREMGVRHQFSGSGNDPVTWDAYQLDHLGTSEFRVGSVNTTILSTTIPVTFDSPFPDANYEVFLQANSNVGVSTYPSNFAPEGFTLNLSAGVNANFSYFAVQSSMLFVTPAPIPG